MVMGNFFKKKTSTKVEVHYVPETLKKIPTTSGITLFKPGILYVSLSIVKKRPFRRDNLKFHLETIDAVWGHDVFFQEAAKISEKMTVSVPWFTETLEEILKRIKEDPREEINIKQERND